MNSNTKIALIVGVLFILTFVTSIAAVFSYGPVLTDPNYVIGAGADPRVFVGAFLDLLLIITNMGCAIVLFPLLKKQNETIALGYVVARLVECTFILVGVLSVLAVVTLRQHAIPRIRLRSSWPAGRSSPSRTGHSCSAQVHGRHRDWADVGMADVPVGPRVASRRAAGCHRRTTACDLGHRRAARRDPGRVHGAAHDDSPGVSGRRFLRLWVPFKGFRHVASAPSMPPPARIRALRSMP